VGGRALEWDHINACDLPPHLDLTQVGLAVDDIRSIQEKAELKKKIEKVRTTKVNLFQSCMRVAFALFFRSYFF